MSKLGTSLKAVVKKIETWDHKTFLSLYQSSFSKKTKKFAKIYSFFGHTYFWCAVWLAFGICGYVTKDYYLFVLLSGGFDQSFALYMLIRYKIVNRNRPFITLENQGVQKLDELIRETKSFPSGHVTFLLFFGFIFAFYFQNWIVLAVFVALDVIMAFTRLILGVHFPSDVIFGFVFGGLFALLYLGLTYVYWVWFYYWLGSWFSLIHPF